METTTEGKTFREGDRVSVNDPALAQIRAIMKRATGQEPPPNHHGTVEHITEGGSLIIVFDDGGSAVPYWPSECELLP